MAETLQWIDVAGGVWNLSDPNTYYVEGPMSPVGEYGLPIQVISHEVPLLPGAREQWIQVKSNDIRFPMWIFGPTPQAVDANRRALSEAMRPTRGVGTLRHVAEDGTTLDLYCRETSRMRDVAARTPGGIKVGVVFSAANPFWHDVNFTTILFAPAGVVSFFPILPLHLSASGASSSFSIQNVGQDFAYPIWTLTGPATNPIFTNSTTNQTLSLNITLTAGQILTIDTRPSQLAVYREDGSNQWAAVSDLSALWGFAVGGNNCSLSVTSPGSGTQIQLQYKQRYEGV